MRVLVVDDQPEAARAISLLLKILGHECRACKTGAGALAEAETFAPELAIVDISLPDISGYDVGKALRARSGLYLVAMTGWDRPEDLARSREVGFDEHVVKPADGATLERIVAAARARIVG